MEDAQKPKSMDQKHLYLFQQYAQLANMYNAYHIIYDFMENPFSVGDKQIQVFNAGRYLVQKFEVCELQHQINRAYVYFALAKVSMSLEAYKTAR